MWQRPTSAQEISSNRRKLASWPTDFLSEYISSPSTWTHLGAFRDNVELQGYHCKIMQNLQSFGCNLPKGSQPSPTQSDTFPCVTRLRQPTTATCTPKLHSQNTLVRITKRALCCCPCCRTQNVKGRLSEGLNVKVLRKNQGK